MAQLVINIGAAANDNTGDPFRNVCQKTNANFAEIYAILDGLAVAQAALAAAIDGKQGETLVALDAATNYSVAADDRNRYRVLSNAAAKTITVRPESVHALPAAGEWHFDNSGAGDATVVAGDGVTVLPPKGGSLILEQGDVVTLKRLAADLFRLIGSTKVAA